MNLLGFFHTEKPKKNFFEQPNNQKPKTKKLNKSHFQGFVNSQYFFMKFSWIGPWVSRIYWCKGHWCGLTYMVVRLSDISSKKGKKGIFGAFRLFWGSPVHASIFEKKSWLFKVFHKWVVPMSLKGNNLVQTSPLLIYRLVNIPHKSINFILIL